MKGKPNVSKRVGWNLFPLMAKNNIRTAAELSRRLDAMGVEVTSIYLSRMMNDRPGRLNTDLLDAFITIFNCTADDLLPVIYNPEEETVQESIPVKTPVKIDKVNSKKELPTNVVKFEKKDDGKKKRQVKNHNDVPEDITGPETFALPTDNDEED